VAAAAIQVECPTAAFDGAELEESTLSDIRSSELIAPEQLLAPHLSINYGN
jgi:hypothetical protein